MTLSSGYSLERIDRLIHQLTPVTQLTAPARWELDLAELVHLSPAALALLTATIETQRERGLLLEGRIVEPRSAPVRNYLHRMDLYRQLGLKPSESFTRRTPVGFRPCQNFRDEEYHVIASDLTAALAESCATDELARNSVRICLDELCENVMHHAEAPAGGFAVAQGWPTKGRFEVGIADLGIGIPASLKKNPDYSGLTDDVAATSTALHPGVTSTPDRNAGIGLFVTKLLLLANGGILLVRSGSAAVFSGARESASQAPAVLPGTLIALRARTDEPLNINEVYRLLDADPGDIDS